YNNLCRLYREMDLYDSAIYYGELSYNLGLKYHVRAYIASASGQLSLIYGAMGDFEKAWHFERIYNLQRDTILNEWKEKEITELTEKYRTESQEDKIKRQQVQIRYSIFAGIIFLILFVVLVIL